MPYSYWSVGGVLISLPKAVGGITTIVCDAWPVRRQTYGYLQPNLYCLVTVEAAFTAIQHTAKCCDLPPPLEL